MSEKYRFPEEGVIEVSIYLTNKAKEAAQILVDQPELEQVDVPGSYGYKLLRTETNDDPNLIYISHIEYGGVEYFIYETQNNKSN